MEEKYFYEIRHSWYEDLYNYFFYGPKAENWENLCISILDEAVDRCISKQSKETCLQHIYVQNIYNQMIAILEEKGYICINNKIDGEFSNWGNDDFFTEYSEPNDLEKRLSENSREKIKQHNKYWDSKDSENQED